MLPGRVKARRAAGKPVERDAGQKIDDRPQARLSQRGAGTGDEDRQERLSDQLRGVGEQWRGGGDRAAQRKQAVRPRRSREPIDAGEVDQRQHRLADEPQCQRAPDCDLRGKRQAGMSGHQGADLGHVPVGADGQEEVEQKGDRNQAQRLDEPKPAKACDEGHDRAADIDDKRDRRPGRVEPPYIRPRSGQPPESERIVALEGEDRERRRIDRDQRRGIRALGASPAQESEPRGAGKGGDDRFARRDRGIEGEGEQRHAAQRQRRRPDGPARKWARKGDNHLHALRSPFRLRPIPCGLRSESQARFHERLPAAP